MKKTYRLFVLLIIFVCYSVAFGIDNGGVCDIYSQLVKNDLELGNIISKINSLDGSWRKNFPKVLKALKERNNDEDFFKFASLVIKKKTDFWTWENLQEASHDFDLAADQILKLENQLSRAIHGRGLADALRKGLTAPQRALFTSGGVPGSEIYGSVVMLIGYPVIVPVYYLVKRNLLLNKGHWGRGPTMPPYTH